MDPDAEPTPAELAEWRAIDLAAAEKWAAERLERARRLGDVEVRQHLGNLVAGLGAARARVAELEAENERLRTAGHAFLDVLALPAHLGQLAGGITAFRAALDAAPTPKD